MKLLVLSSLLAGTVCSGLAQTPAKNKFWINTPQAVRPDSALTMQAFRLAQQFKPASWTVLAAQLAARPRPVTSYLGFGPNKRLIESLRIIASMHRRATPAQTAYWRSHPTPVYDPLMTRIYGSGYGLRLRDEAVSSHATSQLYRHLWGLGLERRQSDYERLCAVLRERAAKVSQLEKALPVLLFVVDTTGQVQDVRADKSRTDFGLTARSRKLILNALREERFFTLEARNLFNKPHPWQERMHRLALKRRLARAGRFLTGWLPTGR